MGKRVLTVDLDPQANLTTCFGLEDADVTIADLMMSVIEEETLPYAFQREVIEAGSKEY